MKKDLQHIKIILKLITAIFLLMFIMIGMIAFKPKFTPLNAMIFAN